MITCLVYMVVGILIGLLISHEKQLRDQKHKLERKEKITSAELSSENLKQYDDLLASLRSLNKSINEAQKKEEVARR